MGFGLFDSSSRAETTTEQNHTQFTDIDGSAVNVAGIKASGKNSIVNLELTDKGAIDSAFQFARQSSSEGYDFARDVTTSAASQITGAVAAVSEAARTETENIFINLQKYALYGAIIWGVVQVFKGRG